ncbi:MAG: hypothetical protein V4606_03125 [Patescibacteria group bacterium]
MSEKFGSDFEASKNDLVERVYAVRSRINESRQFTVLDDIVSFDKDLKKEMVEKYGSTKSLQQVPAWQALVGGTPEPELDLDPEIKELVEGKISIFIKTLEDKIK